MKKFVMVLGLLVPMGSAEIAAAGVVCTGTHNPLVVGVSFPGMRLVYGRPNTYCFYGGRYYSRAEWDDYCRLHSSRFAYRHRHD